MALELPNALEDDLFATLLQLARKDELVQDQVRLHRTESVRVPMRFETGNAKLHHVPAAEHNRHPINQTGALLLPRLWQFGNQPHSPDMP